MRGNKLARTKPGGTASFLYNIRFISFSSIIIYIKVHISFAYFMKYVYNNNLILLYFIFYSVHDSETFFKCDDLS